MGNLIFNIGKQVFNTQLLKSDWDKTDISFGTIYPNTTDVYNKEDFTLYVPINNNNDIAKTVSLHIYAIERYVQFFEYETYSGWTSAITIDANSTYIFDFIGNFNVFGTKNIKIEAYINNINYISTLYYMTIYSYNRILTTSDSRTLTTSDQRAMI